VKCSHEGCSLELQRRDLDQHLKDCDYREVPCQYCGDGVIFIRMDEHVNACGSVPVPCPHGCSDNIIRGNLTHHEQVCLMAIVSCPFAGIGCDHGHITREALTAHMEEFQQRHVTMMGQTLLTQQRLISTQSEQISGLTTRLRDAESFANEMREELRSTGKAQISWIIPDFRLNPVAAAVVAAGDEIDLLSRRITIMVPKVGSCDVVLRLQFEDNDLTFFVIGDNLPSRVCVDGTSLRILKSDGSLWRDKRLGRGMVLENDRGVGSRRFTTKQALLESCIWDDGSLHIEADIALSAIENNGDERVVI
jgi:hypothetical protein